MTEASEHLLSLFARALDCESEAERLAYLNRACLGDPALRSEVETLLRAHEQAGGFLEPLAEGQRPTALDDCATDTKIPGLNPVAGTVVAGRYKLLEVIGEGGMGTVWRADQTEPVRREVALKVIKPGMDSKQVLARFEIERQALALMDHPNIAKVLDGGTTAEGRPFFAMELVKGIPFTEFCDRNRLTPRSRVELFVDVCLAVEHAHQKGIIHRDLKPNNVLVAHCDGKPVPKVIDFGVAKATGRPLTDSTQFTGFGGVIGTPEYMSPEQAELNNNDIDTRSDIYALGVLLYELLTGTTPLGRQCSNRTPLLDVLRTVREDEPPKPSTRLAELADRIAVAANRGMEPNALSRVVHGELDWIAMKALEKDRSRRYDTATALADDVRNYLDERPVIAHPATRRYRLRKFIRRHRAGLTMASVIAVALLLTVAGLTASTIIIDRKQRATENALDAEREAKEELQKTIALQRQNLYDYALGMARRDWMAADMDRARRNLMACPPELRDGEWAYLQRVCNAELAKMKMDATRCRFSHDGKRLVGVAVSPIIWDPSNGESIDRYPTGIKTFSGKIATAVFNREGTHLISATDGRRSFDFTGFSKEKRPVEHPGFVIRVSIPGSIRLAGGFNRKGSFGEAVLSADGQRVLLIDNSDPVTTLFSGPKSITICETYSGRVVCNLDVPRDRTVMQAFLDTEGRTLTWTIAENAIRVWDANTGSFLRLVDLKGFPISRVAVSDDGRRLAASSYSGQASNQVIVVDTQSGQQIAAFSGHEGNIVSMAFSPDGRRLATGGEDRVVKVWTLEDGREELAFRGHATAIVDVTFSPDGMRVASCDRLGGGTIRIWDARPGVRSSAP